MITLRTLAIAVALALASPAAAVQPDEILADPAREARARALSSELRCMVCQNQSIDDSDAELARDLRVLVRERIEAGDSDREVLDFLVARYGEFVLLRPRFEWHTLVLWLAGPVLLVAAGGAAFAAHRRRRVLAEAPRLDADEEARLAALLNPHGEPETPENAARDAAPR
jgi:cytochrome c-type biogenesis protein CcmH